MKVCGNTWKEAARACRAALGPIYNHSKDSFSQLARRHQGPICPAVGNLFLLQL